MTDATGGKVAVLAKIAAQPGKRDELVSALKAAIDNANTEAGTLLYILHLDPDNADGVIFYELYADQDSFSLHGNSDAFKALGVSLRGLAAGRPQLTFLTPVIGKGL
jgi:quinol monooxygenase YgiN